MTLEIPSYLIEESETRQRLVEASQSDATSFSVEDDIFFPPELTETAPIGPLEGMAVVPFSSTPGEEILAALVDEIIARVIGAHDQEIVPIAERCRRYPDTLRPKVLSLRSAGCLQSRRQEVEGLILRCLWRGTLARLDTGSRRTTLREPVFFFICFFQVYSWRHPIYFLKNAVYKDQII